jgi:hypothetical protein
VAVPRALHTEVCLVLADWSRAAAIAVLPAFNTDAVPGFPKTHRQAATTGAVPGIADAGVIEAAVAASEALAIGATPCIADAVGRAVLTFGAVAIRGALDAGVAVRVADGCRSTTVVVLGARHADGASIANRTETDRRRARALGGCAAADAGPVRAAIAVSCALQIAPTTRGA